MVFPIFFVIPIVFGALTYDIYSDNYDLIECQDDFVCQNDELPESDIDKFDPKMVFKPKGPGDF